MNHDSEVFTFTRTIIETSELQNDNTLNLPTHMSFILALYLSKMTPLAVGIALLQYS